MFFFSDLFYDLIVSIKVLVVLKCLKGFLFLEEICLGYFLFALFCSEFVGRCFFEFQYH